MQIDNLEILNNENFVKWFGNSILKNDNGQPIIFYHKSRSKEVFDSFRDDLNKNCFNNCKGFYFVHQNHRCAYENFGDGIELYCYLKIENPLYIYPKSNHALGSNGVVYEPLDINDDFINTHPEYDGIIIKNSFVLYGTDEYVVFSNENIKHISCSDFSNNENIYK